MRLIQVLLNTVLGLYSYVLLFYCVMSWLPAVRQSPLGDLISRLTEPVLTPIRRVLSRYVRSGMFDWSPVAAFVLIYVLRSIISAL